jgi:hypothetical protein
MELRGQVRSQMEFGNEQTKRGALAVGGYVAEANLQTGLMYERARFTY